MTTTPHTNNRALAVTPRPRQRRHAAPRCPERQTRKDLISSSQRSRIQHSAPRRATNYGPTTSPETDRTSLVKQVLNQRRRRKHRPLQTRPTPPAHNTHLSLSRHTHPTSLTGTISSPTRPHTPRRTPHRRPPPRERRRRLALPCSCPDPAVPCPAVP